MDKKKSPAHFRGTDGAEVIPVIRTRAMRGAGVPEDPFREVTQYWSLQGELLAEADSYLAEVKTTPQSASPTARGAKRARENERRKRHGIFD